MPHILIVDDEPAIRMVIRTTLEIRQYQVRVAEDGQQALAMVAEERPDLIVLDWMLPDQTGLDVCLALRANPASAHIPVIFLTAVDDLDRKLAGLETGDDYMVKPFEPQELLARVRVQLRKAAERGQLNSLTSLPGNMLIEEAIMARIIQPQPVFALLYFDLDEFKAYNDHYGFSWGNRLIEQLGQSIERTVYSYGNRGDFIGHVGGDDFVVISTPDRAAALCEGVIADFQHYITALWATQDYPSIFSGVDRTGQQRHFGLPTLSVGVVTNEYRQFTSLVEIGQVVAQVKKAAKGIVGNSYFIDRRRDTPDGEL